MRIGGRDYAVKSGRGEVAGQLAIEARMLRDLADEGSLPGPEIIHHADDLLVLEWIENQNRPMEICHQRTAGEAFARLHATPRPYFGYTYDTTIGGLAQPNPHYTTWTTFFAEQRLMAFATLALARGLMDPSLLTRLEKLSARLPDYLPEPVSPALLHGDAWHGNILTNGNAIPAYIDPALYFGSPEAELSYVTMHGTFGAPFFEAYGANLAIESGFFEDRIDILNIYPNLVHLLLCGPSYIPPIDRTLTRLGL